MDILIDLIIFLIKQGTKARSPGIAPPTPRQAQQQKAVATGQVQAMRKNIAAQQARTRPAVRPRAAGPAATGPASWAQPGVRATVQPLVRSVVAPITGAPLSRPTGPSTRIPGMKLPFLLGELLGPPVALRDSEF